MRKIILNVRTSLLTNVARRILSITSNTSSLRCYADKSTVLQEEVDKFSQISKAWWDVNGPMHALHTLNDLRVPFARDGFLNSRLVPVKFCTGPHPLKGFKFVDVGCGAGIYSEALARIGADVTGIDASEELIKVAREHAALDQSLADNLRYLNVTIEKHLEEASCRYDALVCSEVIEHVENVDVFTEICVKLVKPGGSLFFTTINQNLLSGFLMIFMAENVTKLIPKGTHQYRLLVPPEKLKRMLKSNGCHIAKVHGTFILPNCRWIWVRSTLCTYALHAIKANV